MASLVAAAALTLSPAAAPAAPGVLAAADVQTEGLELFETKIRPVLVASCYECHSQASDAAEGELVLDNRAAMLRGGRSGAVIVPGDTAASRLLRAIDYEHADLQMPPGGKLPDDVIQAFRRWIELGAPDPRDGAAPAVSTIGTRSAEHWAFQKPEPGELPSDESGWSRVGFDRLIAAGLRSQGFEPARPASREELIRRLYYDLTGLAPTQQEIESFASDPDHDAYRRLVDRLLATPQFGERWARHWLDVARFADTKGYVFTEDRTFPNAYKYRDWVIAAFNADMPVDRFLMRQIAADLMPQQQGREHLAAQGYVTLGRRFINSQPDIIADRIDVVFRGMMGLTVACARCHDHKYDPISDEDYYALYGEFVSSDEVQDEQLPLRLVDKEQPENVGVFIRGNANNRGEIVQRGFPEFFSGFAPKVEQGSGRLQLAQAIVHPDNPLTARVFVNRVWGHVFGEQLVRTPSDFGLRCEAPRCQAVLDRLAIEFVENGWSLKWLVRELVTSSTYRQSCEASAELLAADEANELWGRMNRRRLDFESLRDRLLQVAGRLENGTLGGPSEEISTADGGTRRTLYAHIDRQNLPSLFRTFDFASPDAHSPERPHTLVPQQALYLMNSPVVQAAATSLTASLSGENPTQRIAELYRRILAREPREEEVVLGLSFLGQDGPMELAPGDWSFGYGQLEANDQQARVRFAPMRHFAENRWQASPEFPNQQFGYVSVTPTGGHPGNSAELCSIRRWTAPTAGELVIDGQLERPEQQGDGVDGMVVSSRQGVLARWTVLTGKQPTRAGAPAVEPGEQIDFVVTCRDNPNYDSYRWPASIVLKTKVSRRTWRSEEGFHGPAAPPLDLLTQLAQVLLVSNEFLYVD